MLGFGLPWYLRGQLPIYPWGTTDNHIPSAPQWEVEIQFQPNDFCLFRSEEEATPAGKLWLNECKLVVNMGMKSEIPHPVKRRSTFVIPFEGMSFGYECDVISM